MMKIHTTQNLISSVKLQPTNNFLLNSIRYAEKAEQMPQLEPMCDTDKFEKAGIAFKGKKSIADKAIKSGKKTFGERVANRCEKLLGSDSFNKIVESTGKQEVMISSLTSLAICCGLRPLTIMALPEDDKKDSAYASAHSFSSGIFGFIVPFLFIKPLANGYDYAVKNADKYVKKDETLKKMWSHLDLKSIKNADGTRKIMDDWLDITGNKFIADIKDVRKIPLPKHISEITENTLKDKFKGIDIAKFKNGAADKWLAADGKKVTAELKDIYIAVEEKGKTKYYPLMHLEENLLKELYPTVDYASTIGKDGKRLHPDLWKTKDGKAYEFNNDTIFISDWNETNQVTPLITGKTRKEGRKVKDICYQKNNNEDDAWSLGTEISQSMVDDATINTVVDKFGNWLPDIVVAWPRATATVALIPFVLQNVLGMEKFKKPAQAKTKEVA